MSKKTYCDYHGRLECPHCRKIDRKGYDLEDLYLCDDGDSADVVCNHCSGEYVVIVSVSYTNTAMPIGRWDE